MYGFEGKIKTYGVKIPKKCESYKDFSNIEAKINEQNTLFIENQSSKYDVLNVAIQCETRKYMEKGKLL